MSEQKKNRHKNQKRSSINKQGLSEDAADQQPESQLEQRAKKKNTKI